MKRFEILFIVLLFLVFLSYINKPWLGREDFVHFDEVYRLKKAESFKQVFIDRDFSNPALYGNLAIEDPPVCGYIFGAALYYCGFSLKELSGIRNKYNEADPGNWTVENYGFKINDRRLLIVRSIVALFGFLAAVMLYLLARRISGILGGISAALYLSFHPIMAAYSGAVALSDTILMFFWLLSMLLTIYCVASLNQRKIVKVGIFWALAVCSIALAIGTKLNAVLCLAAFVISMTIVFLKERDFHSKKLALIFLAVGVMAATAIFISLYPYLWKNPFSSLQNIMRIAHGTVISTANSQFHSSLPTLFSKIRSIYDVLFWQIPALGYWREPLNPPLGARFIITWDMLFLLLGFSLFLVKFWVSVKNEAAITSQQLICLWCLITFAGITLWIPIRWGRYYLPLLPPISLMIGYAAAFLARFARRTENVKTII